MIGGHRATWCRCVTAPPPPPPHTHTHTPTPTPKPPHLRVRQAEQQVVLQLLDLALVRLDLRWEKGRWSAGCRARVPGVVRAACSRTVPWHPAGPQHNHPGAPHSALASASRCSLWLSSSLFSLRISLPSSWSSSPAWVTVKSMTVTLAADGGWGGGGGGGGGREGRLVGGSWLVVPAAGSTRSTSDPGMQSKRSLQCCEYRRTRPPHPKVPA